MPQKSGFSINPATCSNSCASAVAGSKLRSVQPQILFQRVSQNVSGHAIVPILGRVKRRSSKPLVDWDVMEETSG